MLTVANLIRTLSYKIPEQWKKDVERIKEHGKETSPQNLLKEKAVELKNKITDRTIKRPGLFLRDLHRIISYIDHDINDPTKHGLVQDLSSFSNQISTEARKGEVKLPADTQTKFVTTAERLKDDGTLLTQLANLFNEQYELKPKKSCISQLLRSLMAFDLQRDLKVVNLDDETPIAIKSLVNKIVRQSLTEKELEKAHDTIKDEIKKLKNPERKEMLRYLVLQPIQVELKKIDPMDMDRTKRIKYLKDLKDIFMDENTRRQYSERLEKESLPKGVSPSQISPHSQQIYSSERELKEAFTDLLTLMREFAGKLPRDFVVRSSNLLKRIRTAIG